MGVAAGVRWCLLWEAQGREHACCPSLRVVSMRCTARGRILASLVAVCPGALHPLDGPSARWLVLPATGSGFTSHETCQGCHACRSWGSGCSSSDGAPRKGCRENPVRIPPALTHACWYPPFRDGHSEARGSSRARGVLGKALLLLCESLALGRASVPPWVAEHCAQEGRYPQGQSRVLARAPARPKQR